MDERVTYGDITDAWGKVVLPPITMKEATPLFATLIKRFGRHEDRGKMVVPYWARRGRRVWASPKPQDTQYSANGGLPGLGRMIHDASHAVFEWRHPTLLTHSHRHAELEREMVLYAIRKGWHLPKPGPKQLPKLTGAELRAQKLARTQAAIRRWETKAKRAATALRKLRASERGLIRATLMAGGGE